MDSRIYYRADSIKVRNILALLRFVSQSTQHVNYAHSTIPVGKSTVSPTFFTLLLLIHLSSDSYNGIDVELPHLVSCHE